MAKRDSLYTFTFGPYEGLDIEDVAESEEGLEYLKKLYARSLFDVDEGGIDDRLNMVLFEFLRELSEETEEE